ncbi:MAG TPA: hypothetical protein VEF76_00730 [Patescibacteria group bacterium]|nr:hypothetical protein [Patescibacteria group bacterium]
MEKRNHAVVVNSLFSVALNFFCFLNAVVVYGIVATYQRGTIPENMHEALRYGVPMTILLLTGVSIFFFTKNRDVEGFVASIISALVVIILAFCFGISKGVTLLFIFTLFLLFWNLPFLTARRLSLLVSAVLLLGALLLVPRVWLE